MNWEAELLAQVYSEEVEKHFYQQRYANVKYSYDITKIWKDKHGNEHLIEDMSDTHLQNTIKLLEKTINHGYCDVVNLEKVLKVMKEELKFRELVNRIKRRLDKLNTKTT